jgi:hypothetical protein
MVKSFSFAALQQSPSDKPWAPPLAWATQRGNAEIAPMLREAGAKH